VGQRAHPRSLARGQDHRFHTGFRVNLLGSLPPGCQVGHRRQCCEYTTNTIQG
jgi:hypothetical protein